jgi:hypothetical protein
LTALCCTLSHHGLIAYLEAEFWGGMGTQASALFKGGPAMGAPVIAEDAINRSLKLLGVTARAGCDEFVTVGLGRYRDTDEWVTKNT